MNNIELHKRRMDAYNINSNSSVDVIKNAILATFEINPGYSEITYNNETHGVHILDDGDIRRVGRKWLLTKPDGLELDVGEMFTWNNNEWIVTSKDRETKIQCRCLVRLLNTNIKLETGVEQVKISEDHLGRPVYDETIQYNETLCFAETELSMNRGSGGDDVIILPEGRLRICIPYIPESGVKLGAEFEIYNDQYQIKDIDMTNIVDDKGVIFFIAHRIQN